MQALQRALRPLTQRLQLMIGRAVVQLVDDETKLQALQVSLLAGEVRGEVERFQQYGFTAHPHPGAEAVAASVAGNRDHVLILAVDDRRFRLVGLQQGEVAIYTDEGDKIVLKRGGTIEVTAATKVHLVSPLVECSGDLVVRGNLAVDGDAAVLGTMDVDSHITGGADITASGNVSDQDGAKSMAGMRTTYNAHKHGTSPLPTEGM